MAPKSVGLLVLLQLLALSVLSRVSAFPTPTASADGESTLTGGCAVYVGAQHFGKEWLTREKR